jgi:hypothetical protein
MLTALAEPKHSLLSLASATFRYEPYPIGLARPAFTARLYDELLNSWPDADLFAFMPKLGNKYSLSEVNHPDQYHKFLQRTPVWNDVYQEVKSPQFVHSVLQMLRAGGIDLGIPDDVAVNQPANKGGSLRWAAALDPKRAAALRTRFEFSMLPADGGHIKPHTDSPRKLVTLVVSFCDPRQWQASFGGGTTVLRAADPRQSYNHVNHQLEFSETEVLHTFPFEPNQCVIFVKTFNSLHAVSPMTGAGSAAMRKTLTINVEME